MVLKDGLGVILLWLRLNLNIMGQFSVDRRVSSFKMDLAAKQNPEPEEQELVMQLSPLYLEQLEASRQEGIAIGQQLGEQIGEQRGEQLGEQRGELKGRHSILLKLLVRQVGQLPIELESQVRALSLAKSDLLVDDLMNFRQINDLLEWLQANRS